MWGRERRKVEKVCQKRSFLAVFSKIWSKTLSNKTVAIDRPNGLPKLKFVGSIVFEIMGGDRINPPPPPFVEGVGTKHLRTGRVKRTLLILLHATKVEIVCHGTSNFDEVLRAFTCLAS